MRIETHPQPDNVILYTTLSTKVKAIFPFSPDFSEKIFILVVKAATYYHILCFVFLLFFPF